MRTSSSGLRPGYDTRLETAFEVGKLADLAVLSADVFDPKVLR